MPGEIIPYHTGITVVQGLSFIVSCWLVFEPQLQCGLQGSKEVLNPQYSQQGRKLFLVAGERKKRKLFGPVLPDPILNMSITHHLTE